SNTLDGTTVSLGAQNMYSLSTGAYTGEISATMLSDTGCQYVILGHSERREIFNECDTLINVKLSTALENGLKAIVCIGETLEERENAKTEEIVAQQVRGSLAGITPEQMSDVTLAYEPIWAIGTGKVATPEQAEQVHAHLRSVLIDMFGEATAEAVRIQYGGSVKPENAAELLSQPNVDGALVGGASLTIEAFTGILEAIS
ncbi:MAG: triose-phosphate isomerase, partial [Pirellulales bacterium]|nr:triose-phosphate isomerase [Pirellulales bacterium]